MANTGVGYVTTSTKLIRYGDYTEEVTELTGLVSGPSYVFLGAGSVWRWVTGVSGQTRAVKYTDTLSEELIDVTLPFSLSGTPYGGEVSTGELMVSQSNNLLVIGESGLITNQSLPTARVASHPDLPFVALFISGELYFRDAALDGSQHSVPGVSDSASRIFWFPDLEDVGIVARDTVLRMDISGNVVFSYSLGQFGNFSSADTVAAVLEGSDGFLYLVDMASGEPFTTQASDDINAAIASGFNATHLVMLGNGTCVVTGLLVGVARAYYGDFTPGATSPAVLVYDADALTPGPTSTDIRKESFSGTLENGVTLLSAYTTNGLVVSDEYIFITDSGEAIFGSSLSPALTPAADPFVSFFPGLPTTGTVDPCPPFWQAFNLTLETNLCPEEVVTPNLLQLPAGLEPAGVVDLYGGNVLVTDPNDLLSDSLQPLNTVFQVEQGEEVTGTATYYEGGR